MVEDNPCLSHLHHTGLEDSPEQGHCRHRRRCQERVKVGKEPFDSFEARDGIQRGLQQCDGEALSKSAAAAERGQDPVSSATAAQAPSGGQQEAAPLAEASKPAEHGDDPGQNEKDQGKGQGHDDAEKQDGNKVNQASDGTPKSKDTGNDVNVKETAASTVSMFVNLVGGDAKKALRKYIAQFSSKDSANKNLLGNAPPCRSYQSLILFSEFEDRSNDFENCQTKDAIAQIQKDMKPFKTALSDLLSISDALKQQQKEKDVANAKQEVKGNKRGRPKKTSEQNVPILVEQPQGCAVDISSVIVKEDGSLASPLDVSLPTILRLDVKHAAEFAAARSSTLAALEQKFKSDPARMSTGRSQRSLPADQKG